MQLEEVSEEAFMLQRAELALDTARDMPVHHLARYEPAMG